MSDLAADDPHALGNLSDKLIENENKAIEAQQASGQSRSAYCAQRFAKH